MPCVGTGRRAQVSVSFLYVGVMCCCSALPLFQTVWPVHLVSRMRIGPLLDVDQLHSRHQCVFEQVVHAVTCRRSWSASQHHRTCTISQPGYSFCLRLSCGVAAYPSRCAAGLILAVLLWGYKGHIHEYVAASYDCGHHQVHVTSGRLALLGIAEYDMHQRQFDLRSSYLKRFRCQFPNLVVMSLHYSASIYAMQLVHPTRINWLTEYRSLLGGIWTGDGSRWNP